MSDDEFKCFDGCPHFTFDEWIKSTRELQVKSYGLVPEELEGDELKAWFSMNVLAATDELHEFLNEVPWKPWATNLQVNRSEAIGELVDCLHFIGNLLATLSVSGEELSHRYRGKQNKNAARMAEGYTGLDKCPRCHRDLKEAKCTPEWCQDYGDLYGPEGDDV